MTTRWPSQTAVTLLRSPSAMREHRSTRKAHIRRAARLCACYPKAYKKFCCQSGKVPRVKPHLRGDWIPEGSSAALSVSDDLKLATCSGFSSYLECKKQCDMQESPSLADREKWCFVSQDGQQEKLK